MSRSKRTTKTQMEILINFLDENRVAVTQKMHPLKTDEVEKKWDEIVVILNNVENGAKKDKKQWKNFLYEWKSKTKRKARLHKKLITKTGGGGYLCGELTELENRLMSIIGGWIHVLGCPDLTDIEPGLPCIQQKSTVQEEEKQEDGLEDLEYYVAEGSGLLAVDRDKEQLDVHLTSEAVSTDEICTTPVVTQPIITHTPTFKTAPKKKWKRPQKVASTQLQEAADSYANSTVEMASAVKEMSVSISQLAQALSQISVALCNIVKK
ncbi:unnamed protein product [Callosobruchus maculatus]|uniref:Regulatory protein zeste n=1 Tax=Callosobruchus maculatus TaxID=64391 RepID=A0A653CH21_CALMS|nr:unnamed protein product [Callosobruchus maculatus]